ncbi:hypothetical protein ACXR0O_03750 [Verrucomicrobiota bacterium sgz303538]
MKRTLRSALSVMLAGVLLAGAWKFALPKAPAPVQAQVNAVAESVVEKAKEVLAPAEAVASSVVEKAAVWTKETPKETEGAPLVMLSEPVVILGSPEGTQALPKGTPVRVLKQQGHYVQVQHESRVILIPRTATVLGAYRTN